MKEYALEVYNINTDKFVTQIDIFSTLNEAKQCMMEMPQITGCYYGVAIIQYDENGNEINIERLWGKKYVNVYY